MLQLRNKMIVALLTLATSSLLCIAEDVKPTAQQLAFFESNIRPVLVERCLECHSSDDPENGLDLSTRRGMIEGGKLGTALRPGKPKESLLISAIRHDEFLKMPPKEKLPTQQVVDFTKWVEMGAPWPDSQPEKTSNDNAGQSAAIEFTEKQRKHWSFQPLSNPDPPNVNGFLVATPIDQFILHRLRAADLKPAPRADKRTLIRRATYDLIGLPPTPAEVEAFVTDPTQDAFSKVIDRLLASPRYGERWGRHWLDVARYADSNGLDENLSYEHAWRYRDYVIRSFNEDKPYARFVQEQIAGDLLPEASDEQQSMDRFLATGFLAIGPKMLAEDDPVKMQMDIIDEQLSTLGQTFMALTIGCARCHDHKFDPFPTQDYYSLAGILKSSKTMENHKVVAVWYERPLVSKTVSDQIASIDQKAAKTAVLIEQFRKSERDRLAANAQNNFGQYLLAANELHRFQRQTERPDALNDQSKPYPVVNGYALIESEAFHRGDAARVLAGYGDGIGITGTSGAGHFEFDVVVELPGTYLLEIRHAAADSRPLKLIVNGQQISTSVADQVTGSWHPDGQRWFPAGRLKLNKGVNVIRLESDKVHPHVDRLSLLYDAPQSWPFPLPPPTTISGIARRHQVSAGMVSEWESFLQKVADGTLTQFPSLTPWISFAAVDTESFSADGPALLQQLRTSEGIGGTTPDAVKNKFIARVPSSLEEVAERYQQLLADSSTRSELLQTPSPLVGPKTITPALLTGDRQERLLSLEETQAKLKASRPEFDVAMGVTDSIPEDLRIHLRGSHIALGVPAPRRFPRMFSTINDSNKTERAAWQIPEGQSGRLQLAQWITQPDHPLTWRVIVNRVWHWHFGRGLVPSVDNFGLLGEYPSHPRLLDWLAVQFQKDGGSIKKLHRRIMLSNTYQMSTQYEDSAAAKDVDNKRLWRFRRRRLSGEEIRDSLLAIGTGIDATMGGSLLKVKNRKYVTGSGTSITNEFDNHRRSVYLPVVRSSVYNVLQTFDFPDPAVPSGRRQTSTVAPQALMLMNSKLVDEQTAALAEKLMMVPEPQRAATAMKLILQRPPTDQETAVAADYVRNLRRTTGLPELPREEIEIRVWQSYCRVLLSTNEFAYVE